MRRGSTQCTCILSSWNHKAECVLCASHNSSGVMLSLSMQENASQTGFYQPGPRLSTVSSAAFKCCHKHCNYVFSAHPMRNRVELRVGIFLQWNVTFWGWTAGAESIGGKRLCYYNTTMFGILWVLYTFAFSGHWSFGCCFYSSGGRTQTPQRLPIRTFGSAHKRWLIYKRIS